MKNFFKGLFKRLLKLNWYSPDEQYANLCLKTKQPYDLNEGRLLATLTTAIHDDQLEKARLIIREHPHLVNYLTLSGEPPLILAIRLGRVAFVRMLLANRASCARHGSRYPLNLAIELGHVKIVQLLLKSIRSLRPNQAREILNAQEVGWFSTSDPLSTAIYQRHLSILNCLLPTEISPDALNPTPSQQHFYDSIKTGNLSLVMRFLAEPHAHLVIDEQAIKLSIKFEEIFRYFANLPKHMKPTISSDTFESLDSHFYSRDPRYEEYISLLRKFPNGKTGYEIYRDKKHARKLEALERKTDALLWQSTPCASSASSYVKDSVTSASFSPDTGASKAPSSDSATTSTSLRTAVGFATTKRR